MEALVKINIDIFTLLVECIKVIPVSDRKTRWFGPT